jgi:dolichol-phosphate mannosyltransferase
VAVDNSFARIDRGDAPVERLEDRALRRDRDARPRLAVEPLRVRLAPPNLFVVPAYNERVNLPRLLEDLEDRPHLWPDGSHVIVVDDGSTDGTAEYVDDYEGPLPLQLVRMGTNQGPGAAFRAGFARALRLCPGEGYVITLEADTTSDLDALPRMLERSRHGAELVLASVHGGGKMLNVSRLRLALSVGAGVVVRRALGLDARTVSSFFRVYSAALLRRMIDRHGDQLITEQGFACKAELLAKIVAAGACVEEVPVDLDASRRIGDSKMRILPTLLGYRRLIKEQRRARAAAATAGASGPRVGEPEQVRAWAEDEASPA